MLVLDKDWLFGAALSVTLFGFLWSVLSSLGVEGTPWIFAALIMAIVLIVFSLQVLKLIRWNVINWVVDNSLPHILKYNPAVIIGVGRGGAHIAAMLCHRLSEYEDEDFSKPYFISIDRVYFLEDRSVKTKILDLSTLDFDQIRQTGKALLVTAEIRSGATIEAASNLLNENKVEHKTFTIITKPSANFKVHYYIVKTKLRSVIPWPLSKVHRS